jgi:uncharacterized membrane protein
MKYSVSIPEVHIATIYVEAENEEEAMEIAEEQYSVTGIPDELEYSHTLDKDQWEAYESKEIPMSPLAK